MKKYLLLLTLFFTINSVLAHTDIFLRREYGKVQVSILVGFNHEEIQKAAITGELVEILSNELGNKDTIVVEMIHQYIHRDFKPKYYTSYEELPNKVNKIFIRAFCNSFDPSKIVQIAEYAIENKAKIRKRQTSYGKQQYIEDCLSIDTTSIKF